MTSPPYSTLVSGERFLHLDRDLSARATEKG